MAHLRTKSVGAVVIGCLAIMGCNSDESPGVAQRPIDSAQATVTTNDRIDEVLTGFADTTSQIDTTDSTTIASDGLTAAFGNAPCGNIGSSNVAATASETVDSVPDETTKKLDELIRQIRDEAKEHVFREDLVESNDGNEVVYRMNPAEVCDTDAQCMEGLAENPLRFAVTSYVDDSLNVEMFVGQQRRNPAKARLSDNKISIRGSLSEAMESIRLFMPVEDQKDLPEKLSGTVEASIEKRGEGEFVFTMSVLENLELLTGQAQGKPITVTVRPSSPTAQVTVNSITNTIGLKENLGTVDVSVAGSVVCEDMDCGAKEQSGTFGLHLAGMTGEFAAVAAATELTFTGLGLGPESSYLALDGQHLTTVDLNPDQGRKFTINLQKTAEGTLVTFEPALDLQIAMAMTHLSESLRVDMPDWLFDEVFDVTLGGAPKPSILIPSRSCDANGNPIAKQQIKVVSGALSFDSTSLTSPVDVAAGMCLLPVESDAPEPNPMTLVKAGVCE